MSNIAHIFKRYRNNMTGQLTELAARGGLGVTKRLRKPFAVLHFCCDPVVLANHGMILSNLGYRVVKSHNGFETIQLSASGEIDAVVLELDRNHSDVLLIAREIKRVRASMPTVVVARATPRRILYVHPRVARDAGLHPGNVAPKMFRNLRSRRYTYLTSKPPRTQEIEPMSRRI